MSNTRIIFCALATAGVLLIDQAIAQVPTSGSNGQIFACVNKIGGEVRIVAQNATCRFDESLVVWNIVGPQGPAGPPGPAGAQGPAGPQGPAGGVLAISEFACGASLPLEPGAPVMFYSPSAINVGSGISTAGLLFSSIVLQPGLYQIHWVYGWGWAGAEIRLPGPNGGTPYPQPTLNGSSLLWTIVPPPLLPSYFKPSYGYEVAGFNLGGGLARVSQPNTVLQFVNVGGGAQTGFCELIITRLQ